MKVLIIDDDALITHVYALYLKRKGYQPYMASDGRSGLDILHAHPDIKKVVLDAYMPEMDAFEFLRHIQSDELFAANHPDIYFISAWDKEHIVSRLSAELINQQCIKGIMAKPIDLVLLHFMLQGRVDALAY